MVQSRRPKAQEPGALTSGDRRRWRSQLKRSQLAPLLPFSSLGAHRGLVRPPHGEGGYFLPSVVTPMLVSSRNTRTDASPPFWGPFSPSRWTHHSGCHLEGREQSLIAEDSASEGHVDETAAAAS